MGAPFTSERPRRLCWNWYAAHFGMATPFGRNLQYIEENGYEIAGEIRESYIDGVWNQDDESDWLSEIQVPVRKRTQASLQ